MDNCIEYNGAKSYYGELASMLSKEFQAQCKLFNF